MKKTYVTAIAAAVATAAVCAMLFCGCAASPLDEEWEFEVLIKGGQAVACAPGIVERYPEAEAGDIAIELTDGRITVTADGETVEGRYENLDPYRVTEENFVVYFGHNECRMTVGETVYGDGTSRPTLVLKRIAETHGQGDRMRYVESKENNLNGRRIVPKGLGPVRTLLPCRRKERSRRQRKTFER